MQNKVIQGDCLEKLQDLDTDSVDLIVTDPPYGYSFMGKDWDKAVPSIETWKECLRVLKPGGFAFVMSAPRQDVLSQMITRVGEAGFETSFTSLYWTYASGFPKAGNIGKMVDKRKGLHVPVLVPTKVGNIPEQAGDIALGATGMTDISERVSEEAKALDGSYAGFQPKPAVEVIIVAMKPLSEKTYVDQALKNGKGITWLDDARIPGREESQTQGAYSGETSTPIAGQSSSGKEYPQELGRFPANLLVSNEALNGHSKYFDLDAWADTLPFLAVPKASKSEKNRGLEDFPDTNANRENAALTHAEGRTAGTKNAHPTVKPLKLMSYLITLGSREGDIILDPFAGSCTTCVAAKELKRNYIGIEREEEYIKICEARLEAVTTLL